MFVENTVEKHLLIRRPSTDGFIQNRSLIQVTMTTAAPLFDTVTSIPYEAPPELSNACAVITNNRFTVSAEELAVSNRCRLIGEEQIPALVLGRLGI